MVFGITKTMITYLIKITILSTFFWMLQLKYNKKLKIFQITKSKNIKLIFKIIIIFLVFLQKYLTWGTVFKSKTVIIEFGLIIHIGGNLLHYLCIMYKTHVNESKIVECTNLLVTFKTDQATPNYLWYALLPFVADIICQFLGTVSFYWEDFFSVTKIRTFFFFTIDMYMIINAIVTEINYLVLHVVIVQHFQLINYSLKKNILNFKALLAKRSTLCKVAKQVNNIYSPFLLLVFFLYTFTTIGLVVLIYFSFETSTSRVSNADGIGFSISIVKLLILVWISCKCMYQVTWLKISIFTNFLWI